MLKKGDRVIHEVKPEWGVGVVLDDPASDRVQINFANAGTKTLVASKAPLSSAIARSTSKPQTKPTRSALATPVLAHQPEKIKIPDKWDPEQLSVINSPPHARLVVEAGPGTGKTAVACARVAHLIDECHLPASKIWLVSFTRTAVKEIRDRIMHYVKNPADGLSVKITTLDSQVWYLRQGFDEQEMKKLLESYEANIGRVIEMIEEGDENLLDFVEEIQHLIVDEAQDLVGVRNKLVRRLVDALTSSCGVTVFADSAQAIYGFTGEDGKGGNEPEESVVNGLLNQDSGNFKAIHLTGVHRTNDPELLKIFTEVRELVSRSDLPARKKLEAITDAIRKRAHDEVPKAEEQNLSGRADVLLLYRTRAEVLQASSFLWSNGVEHKLRMSGIPGRLQPWIARIFCDWNDRTINREKFLALWKERVNLPALTDLDTGERAWNDLYNSFKDRAEGIDLVQMRRVLSRSRPPIEFIVPDEMLPGPVVGTIHASKGREADYVHLMMTDDSDNGIEVAEGQIDEEGRVVFVGATRARRKLGIGTSRRLYASTVDGSGRVYSIGKAGDKAARVEFGRDNDVDVHKQVEQLALRSAANTKMVQEFLWRNAYAHVELFAEAVPTMNYLQWLHAKDGKHGYVGCLAKSVQKDLWTIGRKVGERCGITSLKPGSKINHLHMTGARTVVLPENDDLAGRLHQPFARSGIFLVPLVCGFVKVFFNLYRPKGR